MQSLLTRRQFLAATGGAALAAPLVGAQDTPRRLRVACVYTVLRFRSHAFDFLENFVRPYLFNGRLTESGMDVVALYADQRVPEGDMTDMVSRQFKIPLFKTIRDALTLGGKQLAVDAVLSIGEHGEYPVNKLGQKEYPRKRFFDEIVAVMRQSNRFVPLFNDKHLSYRWDWAKEMYDTAQKHRIPFHAGSSVPLTMRSPNVEVPPGSRIEEAISVHGGGMEVYDFHAFEVLQSLVEARKGGEVGLSSVELLEGDALWKAAQAGRWSPALAEAALAHEFGKNIPNLRQPLANEKPEAAHAIVLTYRDGFRATILKVGRSSTRWAFACRLAGEKQPRSFRYQVGPWGNRNLFMALSHAIQHTFRTGQAPYPVERTLLASGMLEAAMQSRAERRPQRTPHLEFAYQPRDFRAMREMGASWPILQKIAEPKEFHRFTGKVQG